MSCSFWSPSLKFQHIIWSPRMGHQWYWYWVVCQFPTTAQSTCHTSKCWLALTVWCTCPCREPVRQSSLGLLVTRFWTQTRQWVLPRNTLYKGQLQNIRKWSELYATCGAPSYLLQMHHKCCLSVLSMPLATYNVHGPYQFSYACMVIYVTMARAASQFLLGRRFSILAHINQQHMESVVAPVLQPLSLTNLLRACLVLAETR